MTATQSQSSFKHLSTQALIHGIGVPITRFMNATGLYGWMLHTFKQQIASRRVANNFGAYQPTKHDVLVCTYPKSGTNWMLQLAFQLAFRGEGEFDNVHQYIPWPDALMPVEAKLEDESIAARSPFGLRIIKTHLWGEYLPYTPDARYICILRDPKDVLVSSYFFVRDVALGALMPSVKTWYETFLSDAFFLGSWTDNLYHYWKMRHQPNVMVITFEQMKADLMGIVRQTANFLDVDLTEAELQTVYEKSTFQYMKGVEHKFNPPAVTPMANGGAKMIRKGQSGASSELLTLEQQRQMDDYCRAELRRLSSDFPYDEMFTVA